MITLYNIDVDKFTELVDGAKGNVYMVTDEGDRLNLKSKLCQLYGLKMLLDAVDTGTITATLECDDVNDNKMFMDYMISKKMPSQN